MRTNIVLMWILTGFFFLTAIVYAIWSFAVSGPDFLSPANQDIEGLWVGLVSFVLAGLLAALIAFYLMVAYRKQGGELPEDRPTADMDEDAELGFFPPWSWWPVVLAGAIGVAFVGLAAGVWLTIFVAPLVLIAIVGWVYEYYRGYFAH